MNSSSFTVLGFCIDDPLGKLRKKFGFDADNVPFGLYDGYRTPAERGDNPNVLEIEDLLITAAMNSRIGASATRTFWDGIQGQQAWHAESGDLLTQLSPGLDLADASDQQLILIHRLFKALCSIKGVKTAVAGKILCRKRPRCVPMLDSVVLPLACQPWRTMGSMTSILCRGQNGIASSEACVFSAICAEKEGGNSITFVSRSVCFLEIQNYHPCVPPRQCSGGKLSKSRCLQTLDWFAVVITDAFVRSWAGTRGVTQSDILFQNEGRLSRSRRAGQGCGGTRTSVRSERA
jgi:hypothetical protein